MPLVLLAASLTSIADAAPPARINNLVNRSQFTVQDRNRIRDWAGYWCDQLERARPEEVRDARQSLLEPLRSPVVVTEAFRLEYTEAALPRLEKIVAGSNPLTGYNALHVIGTLGTQKALEALLRHCDANDQPNFGLRLWAAKCLPIAIRQGTLGQNDINQALRRLNLAAGREPHWLILRRQFEAIASVPGPVSREVQLAVLDKMTDRMSEQAAGPSELMDAAYPALKLIRDVHLRLPPNEQNAFGAELAPLLCDVCTVAQVHWDLAQESKLKDAYGGAVDIAENLLKFINAQQPGAPPGPQTAMGRAWNERDKPRFSADHDKWKGILSKPPYRKR